MKIIMGIRRSKQCFTRVAKLQRSFPSNYHHDHVTLDCRIAEISFPGPLTERQQAWLDDKMKHGKILRYTVEDHPEDCMWCRADLDRLKRQGIKVEGFTA